MSASMSPETLSTDFILWDMGPFSSNLTTPLRVRLTLDGEVIVSAAFETGYCHRGLEKTFEQQSWAGGVPFADRLDPEAAVFGELAYCLAAEEILDLEVPARAQMVRVILSELTRISCHLRYMALMARASGCETAIHYLLRDRERILDLFELISGARHSLSILRIGGIAHPMTEGFVERVLEVCDLIHIRIKEYNDLLTFNQGFLKRTTYSGVIYEDQTRRAGLTGPNARASGVPWDVRKERPYSGYGQLDFAVPIGKGEYGAPGDTYDRFLIRLREMSECLRLIRDASDRLPIDKGILADVPSPLIIPEGEAFIRVESPRGQLGCHVISDGSERPWRVRFAPPSLGSFAILPELLVGVRAGDFPMIFQSLDLSMPEVDR